MAIQYLGTSISGVSGDTKPTLSKALSDQELASFMGGWVGDIYDEALPEDPDIIDTLLAALSTPPRALTDAGGAAIKETLKSFDKAARDPTAKSTFDAMLNAMGLAGTTSFALHGKRAFDPTVLSAMGAKPGKKPQEYVHGFDLMDLDSISKEGLRPGSSIAQVGSKAEGYTTGQTLRLHAPAQVKGEQARAFAQDMPYTTNAKTINPKEVTRVDVDLEDIPVKVTQADIDKNFDKFEKAGAKVLGRPLVTGDDYYELYTKKPVMSRWSEDIMDDVAQLDNPPSIHTKNYINEIRKRFPNAEIFKKQYIEDLDDVIYKPVRKKKKTPANPKS